MTTTLDAIYEGGNLLLPCPLPLADKSPVRITIETNIEREAWLTLSEESLKNVWNNEPDDVFNELLQK